MRLSINQASERSGISPGTLRSWAERGKVKAIRLAHSWAFPTDKDGGLIFASGRFPYTPEPPEGYIPLPDMAHKMGVSRQWGYMLLEEGAWPEAVTAPVFRDGKRYSVVWVPDRAPLPPEKRDKTEVPEEQFQIEEPKELLDVEEFATLKGIDEEKLRDLLRSGRVVGAIKSPNGRWTISRTAKILGPEANLATKEDKVPEGWVDLATYAKLKGQSPAYLRRIAWQGRVPAVQVNRRWYFPPEG